MLFESVLVVNEDSEFYLEVGFVCSNVDLFCERYGYDLSDVDTLDYKVRFGEGEFWFREESLESI